MCVMFRLCMVVWVCIFVFRVCRCGWIGILIGFIVGWLMGWKVQFVLLGLDRQGQLVRLVGVLSGGCFVNMVGDVYKLCGISIMWCVMSDEFGSIWLIIMKMMLQLLVSRLGCFYEMCIWICRCGYFLSVWYIGLVRCCVLILYGVVMCSVLVMVLLVVVVLVCILCRCLNNGVMLLQNCELVLVSCNWCVVCVMSCMFSVVFSFDMVVLVVDLGMFSVLVVVVKLLVFIMWQKVFQLFYFIVCMIGQCFQSWLFIWLVGKFMFGYMLL